MKLIVVPGAAVALTALLAGAAPQSTGGGPTLFRGATIIDGRGGPLATGVTLIVRNGRVEAVRPSASAQPARGTPVVDLTGTFVVPGLISAHAHVSDVDGLKPRAYTIENTLRQLRVFARYGVTTVVSLGGEQAAAFDARTAQNAPGLDRAHIVLAGEIITATKIGRAHV